MNLQLDMKTMFLSLVIGHLFTAVLISAYWRRHMKEAPVNTFFLAKCVQAAAWFIGILRGGVNDNLNISLTNTMLFLGYALEILAVLSLQNMYNQRTRKIYIILTAVNIIGFHLIMLFNNVESVRIAFASTGTTALLIVPAYRMILTKASSMLVKTMGYFYLFIIAYSLIRAAAALFTGYSMSYFTSGNYQTLSFLALYLVMISGNTGFALLMKERADQELIRLANYDDLTGAMNRRIFISLANQNLTAYSKAKKPVSLILFDVDHFKTINDTYGHDAGDKVLSSLAKQVKLGLDEEDLFARYGGDEFAILLPGKDETASSEKAEWIRKAVHGMVIQGLPIGYTISLGVMTVIPDQHTQLRTLYSSCDQALYNAKKNGRNNLWRGSIG